MVVTIIFFCRFVQSLRQKYLSAKIIHEVRPFFREGPRKLGFF